MIRLLHLLPIIAIIAAVTAALRARRSAAFAREFVKAGVSLAVGFVGLAVLILLAGLLL